MGSTPIPLHDPYRTFAQQGWQCPVCRTVHAPFVPSCHRCSPVVVVKTTTWTASPTGDTDD